MQKIVEDKDASSQELKIKEINSGIYMFNKEKLFEALQQVKPENVQGEYYLTDVFGYFSNHGMQIAAVKALEPLEVMGINDIEQLEGVRQILDSRTGV